MLLREIKYLPRTAKHVTGFTVVDDMIELPVSIKVVSDDESGYIPCCAKDGSWYMRKRRNVYTESEWLKRCMTMVAEGECAGMSYGYFGYGYEGDVRGLLGRHGDDDRKEFDAWYRSQNRERNNAQCRVNAKRYKSERIANGK